MGRNRKTKTIVVKAASRTENGEFSAKSNDAITTFIYKSLDQDEFRRRMEESFAPVYLNSMSIIQGVALGLLCQQTFPLFQPGNSLPSLPFPNLPYIGMAFSMIVGVSYEYNWFVGIHRWSQKFIDTLIPFALGFIEIGAILSMGQPLRWWSLLTVFNFFGAFAFWNTWKNTKKEMFTKSEMFEHFKSNSRSSIFLALSSGVYCLIVCLFYARLQRWCSAWYKLDLPIAIVYVAFMSRLLFKDKRFVDQAHKKLSLQY